MKFARKVFRLPPGPPSRIIVFLPETPGLLEHANQLGLYFCQPVHLAISMALIAFGKHPDEYPEMREELVDVFGCRGVNGRERVPERIKRFDAPKRVKTAAGLVQWYLEERFPAPSLTYLPRGWDSDDDDDMKRSNS
ncbi:hypothetical protein F5Y10DRAFT_266600 [Nemania abortiva]|nr:hypothetical protein F5Y10DRAFT_266600 [Nemania abortiva]